MRTRTHRSIDLEIAKLRQEIKGLHKYKTYKTVDQQRLAMDIQAKQDRIRQLSGT